AEAVYRGAGVDPHEVAEQHVAVEVETTLRGHTRRVPVAPCIEVEPRALLEGVRPVEAKREPVAEQLVVRARQEAEVVDLEARGETLVYCLEACSSAAELADRD